MIPDSGLVVHATARGGRRTLHGGPRRPACRRRARRRALSPERRLGVGRAAGCGRLLRALRVPHHRPAAGRARAGGCDRPGSLLAAPGATPAPGTLGDAGGGHPLDRLPRPLAGGGRSRRPGRGPPLLQQLVVRVPARLVFRELRGALATRPSLVAGGRGAVLPGLAAAPDPGHQMRAAALAAGRRRGRGRGRLRLGDGHPPPAGQRSHPRLRGHGHPRVSASHRRRSGLRLAEPPAHRAHLGTPAPRTRCPGRGRDGRHRRHGDGHQRIPDLPLPRRHGHPLPRHGGGGRRARPSVDAPRQDSRCTAAALDRGAVLRHLPLALPDHRAHLSRRRHRRPAPDPGPGGCDPGGGGALVALCRGTDPPARVPRCLRRAHGAALVGEGRPHRPLGRRGGRPARAGRFRGGTLRDHADRHRRRA